MIAFLIVDIDSLLTQIDERGLTVSLQEIAVGLKGGAALAAGLGNFENLQAVAVANWDHDRINNPLIPQDSRIDVIFRIAGYDIFNVTRRADLADALIIHYFAFGTQPVDELILVTTSSDLIPLVRRVRVTRQARIRVWGTSDVLKDTEFAGEVIFQPLESLLGVQTKKVAMYIDFENIIIGLNKQHYVLNLDVLIQNFIAEATLYGQPVKIAAYAPWGQRNTMPTLVDDQLQDITDDIPNHLMMANIDPVYNLPGKNSADMRIAGDILAHSNYSDAADVYILASGDRDFNDVLSTLLTRGKQVVVWGVRGSISRQLEQHPGVVIRYVEDFIALSRETATIGEDDVESHAFMPSQWTNLILRFDMLAHAREVSVLSVQELRLYLQENDQDASEEAVLQEIQDALDHDLLRFSSPDQQRVMLNAKHPTAEHTRLIRDRILNRVKNTLLVRQWEYVNYKFLLHGLEMDWILVEQPHMNMSDEWRSVWIDNLVSVGILSTKTIPGHNSLTDGIQVLELVNDPMKPDGLNDGTLSVDDGQYTWSMFDLETLMTRVPDVANMVYRIVVSVEQFTSFRKFDWCPLRSLHRRLSSYDVEMSFQRAVEYLIAHNAAVIDEHDNPQSKFSTKGISVVQDNAICMEILNQRSDFIKLLLKLDDENMVISHKNVRNFVTDQVERIPLWISIMETENVLKVVTAHSDRYNLFRKHHTVTLIDASQS